ncbi:MAG TPA: GNAT family N-acetyltransferase [Gemmatimonadaceae bacterium]|nr:GNAT family N-acetyltransferase [Gemmatimonadaceae bacterium]
MPLPATIRPATPDDAATLSAFARDCFHDAFAADNRAEDMAAYLAATFSPERQAAEIADAATTVLLAHVDGALAGYALLATGAAPPAITGPAPIELRRFYVARPWHGRGVADRLMDAVLDTARARGAATLWLGVWERNPRAIAYYRKRGFVDVGSWAFVLGSDRQTDRVMTRAISDER